MRFLGPPYKKQTMTSNFIVKCDIFVHYNVAISWTLQRVKSHVVNTFIMGGAHRAYKK